MKAHQAQTAMLVLTVLLALHLPSYAFDDVGVTSGVGMTSTVGLASQASNQQDSSRSDTSYGNGSQSLENSALNQGVASAQSVGSSAGVSLAPESVSQVTLIEAANTLQVCKQSCEQTKVQCLQGADPSNTLAATLCRIDSADCQLPCIQNLLNEVTGIPTPPIIGVDQAAALAKQRNEAVRALLLQDLGNAKLAIRRGALNLQRVALAEGIRITLEKYAAYGVPEGQTRIRTASRDLTTCSEGATFQTCECERDALARAGDDTTLLTQLLFQCELQGTASQLGCARATVHRYLDID
jgi:hypothetical protein